VPEKQFRKRTVSYIPAFLSITLVIFLAGLFGIFLLHAGKLKKEIKENLQLNVYFKDDAREADIIRLQKQLEAMRNVINVKYTSKEEALKKWQQDLGENPMSVLDFNPFPNSLDVRFQSDYVAVDSLENVKHLLERNLSVREVTYDKAIVSNIDRNIKMVGLILLSVALLMGLVSITLINNTIRLTLYSKRFLIKSMQFVGATKNFIRRPFIIKGILIGFLSGIFAALLLMITLYLVTYYFPNLEALQNYIQIGLLHFLLIIIGIAVTGLSSYFAINRYLKLKLDDLF
jgi:cell division transport system permease protein